jgi:hypothetical protein
LPTNILCKPSPQSPELVSLLASRFDLAGGPAVASRPNFYPPDKPLAQLLSEFKDELKEFAATRIAMLRAEMREKVTTASSALMAVAAGAVFALLALLFLGFAFVGLLAMAFGGGAGAWAGAFAIVGVLSLLSGSLALGFGVRQLKERGLKPERTLRILKQDQIWLQHETRSER